MKHLKLLSTVLLITHLFVLLGCSKKKDESPAESNSQTHVESAAHSPYGKELHEGPPYLKQYEVNGLKFEAGFMPDKSEYVWGEPIHYFTYIVKNTGKTMSFKEGGDYRGGRSESYRITAIDADGESVPVPRMMRMGGMVGFEKIHPGEVYRKMMRVSRRLTFSGPGEYTVTGERTLELGESSDENSLRLPTKTSFQLTVHPYSKERMAGVIEKLARQIRAAGNIVPKPLEYTEPTEMSGANRLYLAMSTLAAIKDELAFEHLIAMAKDGQLELRNATLRRLGGFASSKAQTVVLDALHDNEEGIRVAASEALGSMKTDAAIDALLASLADESPKVAEATLRAMGHSRLPRVFDILVKSLDPKDNKRRAAVDGLVAYGGENAVKALKTCVDDDDLDFREDLVRKLAEDLKEPIDARWLVPVIKSRKNTHTIGDAPRLMRLYCGARAVPALLSCLDYEDPAIRKYYNHIVVYSQGWCEGGMRIPWISDLNRDGTPEELEQNRKTLKAIKAWVDYYYKRRMAEPAKPQHYNREEYEKSWGEPAHGIKIRAVLGQRVWPEGMVQPIRIDIREDPGGGSIHLSSVPNSLEVEINGEWYVHEPALKEPTMGIDAGHGASYHNLLLDEGWRRKSDQQALQHAPGKHTLRLRLGVNSTGQRSELATSKPIQFETIGVD